MGLSPHDNFPQFNKAIALETRDVAVDNFVFLTNIALLERRSDQLTEIVIFRAVGSVSIPPFAVPPLSST